VSNSHIITQNAGRFPIQRVDAGVVLDIGSIAYLDEMHVPTYYGIEPNSTVISHFHVSHYYGTFAEVAMFAKSGSGHPLQSLYNSHIFVLCFLKSGAGFL
jgi:hypothetical protein